MHNNNYFMHNKYRNVKDKDESCPTADLSYIRPSQWSGLFDRWAVEHSPGFLLGEGSSCEKLQQTRGLHRKLKRNSCTWHSVEGVENENSARPPNLTLAPCDLDQMTNGPCDPQSWPLHPLALWTTFTSLQRNQFFTFHNIVFARLVTYEQTKRQANIQVENITPSF